MQFILVLLIPLLSVVLVPIISKNRRIFYSALFVVALIQMYLAFSLPIDATLSLPYIGLFFHIDSYSKIFIDLISVSWLISIFYTSSFSKYNFQHKLPFFFGLLNTLLSVVLMNACAGNLQTLFVFYLLGIPLTYPLLSLRETNESKRGAKMFLNQTLRPTLLILLPAIIITFYLIGNLNFLEGNSFLSEGVNPYIGGLLLAMFIFGLSKNSVMPFHTWLPNTHKTPAPISALIHSVATVKTASIAMIKIAVFIFNLDYIRTLTSSFFTGGFLIYLLGFTAIYTAYRALKTDDLKQRFTLSTVGQMSYILLAILVGTEIGIMAATLHIVTHSIAKACLFYVAGFFNSMYGSCSAKETARIIPSHKSLAIVIAICGLSITGFPFLAGFYSKDLMLLEEWHTGNYASSIFLIIGSLINLFYILPVVKNAFKPIDPELQVKKIPLGMVLTFSISILLILSSNFYMSYLTLMIQ